MLKEQVTMSNRAIYITDNDLKRLRELLEDTTRGNNRAKDALKNLEAELDRGVLVSSQEVPHDVVTMNSTARLVDLDTGEEMLFTLVFPDDADISAGKISVFAPIGTAMLGYRVGDVIEWAVPEGRRRLKVTEVLYQPEASGNYHL
jgi:regulator of nucleoside diphosphate kinase